MPYSKNEHEKILVPQKEENLEEAADLLAALIVEAVEKRLQAGEKLPKGSSPLKK